SSHEGEFVTSITTEAPFNASARPSPVRELTPEDGDAATTSCPRSRSFPTSFDPMSPVPPITTIFMIVLSYANEAILNCGLFAMTEQAHRFVTRCRLSASEVLSEATVQLSTSAWSEHKVLYSSRSLGKYPAAMVSTLESRGLSAI